MNERDQIIECLNGINEGNEELYFSGDCWQNNLLKFLCKGMIFLLTKELKKK